MTLTSAARDTYESPSVAIARVMGLHAPETLSDLDLVERVEKGLSLASVERVADHLDPVDKTLKYKIIPRSSYARLKAGNKRLSRDQSEKVFAMAKVVTEALRLWKGDDAAAKRFLVRPHPLLNGRTPLDIAQQSTAGAELVVDLIGRARAGVAI